MKENEGNENHIRILGNLFDYRQHRQQKEKKPVL